MEATPPTTALATRLPTLKSRPLIIGPANAVIPADRAPGPHLPRCNTADAHPTRACPAILPRDPLGKLVPTKSKAAAVAIAVIPALNANPQSPLVTPVLTVLTMPAHSGPRGVNAVQAAVAATCTMATKFCLMNLATSLKALPMALKMGFQKQPRKQ